MVYLIVPSIGFGVNPVVMVVHLFKSAMVLFS